MVQPHIYSLPIELLFSISDLLEINDQFNLAFSSNYLWYIYSSRINEYSSLYSQYGNITSSTSDSKTILWDVAEAILKKPLIAYFVRTLDLTEFQPYFDPTVTIEAEIHTNSIRPPTDLVHLALDFVKNNSTPFEGLFGPNYLKFLENNLNNGNTNMIIAVLLVLTREVRQFSCAHLVGYSGLTTSAFPLKVVLTLPYTHCTFRNQNGFYVLKDFWDATAMPILHRLRKVKVTSYDYGIHPEALRSLQYQHSVREVHGVRVVHRTQYSGPDGERFRDKENDIQDDDDRRTEPPLASFVERQLDRLILTESCIDPYFLRNYLIGIPQLKELHYEQGFGHPEGSTIYHPRIFFTQILRSPARKTLEVLRIDSIVNLSDQFPNRHWPAPVVRLKSKWVPNLRSLYCNICVFRRDLDDPNESFEDKCENTIHTSYYHSKVPETEVFVDLAALLPQTLRQLTLLGLKDFDQQTMVKLVERIKEGSSEGVPELREIVIKESQQVSDHVRAIILSAARKNSVRVVWEVPIGSE